MPVGRPVVRARVRLAAAAGGQLYQCHLGSEGPRGPPAKCGPVVARWNDHGLRAAIPLKA